MKIELLGNPKTIMSNPASPHNYFAWPTVARLKNGSIAVAASGFRLEHICPFGKAVMCLSTDEGETYTFPAPIIDTPLDDRDAGLCVFGENGVILTSFNNSADFQRQHNQDNKYVQSYIDTITPENEEKYLGSTFRISNDNGKTFSEIYRSPVTSPHGPTELSDGTILWVGNKFHNPLGGIEVHKLNTETAKTEFIGKIPFDNADIFLNEPHLIELPDGKLICHIRGENDTMFTTFQSISEDKGKTWSYPQMLLDEAGGAPPHLILLSSGALLCTYSRRKPPYGIMAMVSLDYGKNWEKDLRLFTADESDDLGYPSTIELSDGALLTVFYATEKDGIPCRIFQQKWNLIY